MTVSYSRPRLQDDPFISHDGLRWEDFATALRSHPELRASLTNQVMLLLMQPDFDALMRFVQDVIDHPVETAMALAL